MTAGIPVHRARTLWLACTRWALALLCGAAALPAQMASQLSPTDADNLERRLLSNPEDFAVRGRLVTYYYRIAAREPRLKHIFWLIEHHPESELVGFSSAQISPGGGTLNDDADYRRAREIWLRQIQRKASDPLALGNAVKFFWQPGGDLGTAADLLKRLRRLEPKNDNWTQRLASLYAFTLLESGSPPPDRPDPALVERFKTELETSTDAALVAYAGSLLTRTQPTRPELVPVVEFGKRLLQSTGESRTSGVAPAHPAGTAAKAGVSNSAASDVPGGAVPAPRLPAANIIPRVPPEDPRDAPERIRVSGNLQSALLPEQAKILYPPLAKEARAQGVILLSLTIAEDGSVKHVQVVSGHAFLAAAATDAIKRWVYRPTLVNGKPVEVVTTVEVDFTLPQ